MQKQFDTIQIYLLDGQATAVRMIDELSKWMGLLRLVIFPRRCYEYKLKWGDKGYLLDGFTENPLPNSIRIKLSDLEKADAVVKELRRAGIEDIKYYKTAVDKLLSHELYRIGAMVIIFSLVVVSVVVVANTIKLTVLARAREINIMKYVGANNWFIRGPFLVEGMLIGFISAALSAGLIALVYNKIMELFGTDMFLMFSVRMVPEGFLIENLIMIFTALGVCIGAFGSIISMRRFGYIRGKGKEMKAKRWICCSLIAMLLFSLTSLFELCRQRADKLDELNRQISKLQSQLKAGKAEESRLNSQIKNLDKLIKAAESEIRGLQNEIAQTNKKIAEVEEQLRIKQAEIDEQNERMSDRIRAMYKNGDVGILEVLLGSKCMTDFLTNLDMAQRIFDNDVALLEQLEEQHKSIEKYRNQLDELKRKLSSKQQEEAQSRISWS